MDLELEKFAMKTNVSDNVAYITKLFLDCIRESTTGLEQNNFTG